MSDFTHFNNAGRAMMVDIGSKDETQRTAVAAGALRVSAETFALIKSGGMKKGDVLGTAQIAGIMAAKRTWELIPMCHQVALTKVDIAFELEEETRRVLICATASCKGMTGVEMEALTGVQVTLLTIYDMCKAIDKHMVMSEIHLIEKTGGKSGDFRFEEEQ